MTRTLTTADELVEVFTRVLGDKGEVVAVDAAGRAVIALVRETFEVGFALDPEHGSFGIAVRIGPTLSQTVFFGELPLLEPSEDAVTLMFQRVDRWCAMQLPAQAR